MYVESCQSIAAAAAVAAPSSQVSWEKVEGFRGYTPDTKVEPQFQTDQAGPLDSLNEEQKQIDSSYLRQNTSVQIMSKSLIHVHIT